MAVSGVEYHFLEGGGGSGSQSWSRYRHLLRLQMQLPSLTSRISYPMAEHRDSHSTLDISSSLTFEPTVVQLSIVSTKIMIVFFMRSPEFRCRLLEELER